MKKYRLLYLTMLLSFITSNIFAQYEFLEPDEAFKPSVSLKENAFNVQIKLGKDIFLYQEKLSYTIKGSDKIKLLPVEAPKAEEKDGYQVIYADINLDVPFERLSGDALEFVFVLGYQGCSNMGICYNPTKKEFKFSLPASSAVAKQGVDISEQDSIAGILKNGGFVLTLATFFGFGLLLALTPCIFPMIPILSSIIVSQKNITTKRAFFLSLVYVIAMSLTYTVAGIMAGLFGENIQTAMQTPEVIISFSVLFVVLAFSMFGYYDIQMPQSIQSKLSKKSQDSGGSITGVAFMGLLSALIVGPCVAAPLAGALVYIGQTGDALLGGAALFMLSLGMGMPLLLVGTAAGKFMPKPGGWMDGVKAFFGVVMLAVAIWMLSRVISETLTLTLYAVLFMISSVYLGTFETLDKNASGAKKFLKGLGLVTFVYALALFVGALGGASNPYSPLKPFTAKAVSTVSKEGSTNKKAFNYVYINNKTELEHALKNKKTAFAMVDFYADWCVSCKEMEEGPFLDKEVKAFLDSMTIIKIDMTDNTQAHKDLLKEFNVFGPPAYLFFKEASTELSAKRVVGFMPTQKFKAHLEGVMKQ